MAKVIQITGGSGGTLTLPWPLFGAGEEFATTAKFGRVRTGALRTYITTDLTKLTMSWEFNRVPQASFALFQTKLLCTTTLIVGFYVDNVLQYSYTGLFKTPIVEGLYDRNGAVSFQTQFIGTRTDV